MDDMDFELFLEREMLECAIEGLHYTANLEDAENYFTRVLNETTVNRNVAKNLIIKGLKTFIGGHEYMRQELINLVENL